MTTVLRSASGQSGEQRFHFFRGFQVKLAVGAPQLMAFIQRRLMADSHQHVVEPVPIPPMIMDVVRRHDGEADGPGQLPQARDALFVAPHEMMLKLHEHAVGPEGVLQLPQPRLRPGHIAPVHQLNEAAFTASRQADEPVGVAPQHVFREAGFAPGGMDVGRAQKAAQMAVAPAGLRQQREMAAVGQRHFRPGNRKQPAGPGVMGKSHRSVQAVVIGEGQRPVA